MNISATTQKEASFSQPRLLLHLEGAAMFGGAIVFYAMNGGSLWLFLLLLLAPDLGMLGYLAGERTGATVYNIVHWIALPLVLGIGALIADWHMGIMLALIWMAHIGMDRMIGYGLKYPTGFKDTHLSRL